MIDSDDVLLLRPAREGSGFPKVRVAGPTPGESDVSRGLVMATLCYPNEPVDDAFAFFFEHAVRPVLEDAGVPILSSFVTEGSSNNFPALPVREGANAFVWFSRFRDRASYDRRAAALNRSQRWRGELHKSWRPT
jgi:hypothetical protein